jgi:hypothetical protein
MQQVLTIAEWAVWGIGLLYCIVFLIGRHQDGGVVMLSRRYAVLLGIGLVVTFFADVSKLHLLWWAALAFPVNLFLLSITTKMRIRSAARKLAAEAPHPLSADDEENASTRAEVDELKRELDMLENPDTICSFGQMAYDGDGVEQDFVEAAGWYKIAAERGSARAQHNLALMYENGEGVPQDVAEAARWYRQAADQGSAASQNNLAALYEYGEGVPQDGNIALDLYRQAARGGDKNANANAQRLEALLRGPACERKRHEKVVFAFSDLMAEHSPLIGDCSRLPFPKRTLLYSIKWIMDEYETSRETTDDEKLRQAYDNALRSLSHLFTRLARDWQEIDPADKDAIEKLRDCESFPEWALQYKRKYIDDERASNETLEVTLQVMRDKTEQKKATR